jgi:hypothetical protein
MLDPSETALVRELRAHIYEMELQNTDLKRQVAELRAAVSALMEPDMPRILRTPGGVMVLDEVSDERTRLVGARQPRGAR